MRTIVPFVLSIAISGVLIAQPGVPPQIESIEKQTESIERKIADGRATVQDRVTLINLYLNARNVEGRRRQILWLTEHQPESSSFRTTRYSNAGFDMRPANSLPDPIGFDQCAELWRAYAATPDASPKVIANAAYFFRFADRDYALSILRKAAASHPDDLVGQAFPPGHDVDIAKVRGMLDVLSMGGLVDGRVNSLHSDDHARMLASAKKSREDVESSNDPMLLSAAGETLTELAFMLDVAYQDVPALGGDDPLDVAERWLLKASRIDPNRKDLKTTLARVYEREANQARDPRQKVQLLRQADAMTENSSSLPQLAMAEFEAGNDDAATRDVRRLLERKIPPPNFLHAGHIVLGRIALANGDLLTAKAELMASIPAKGNFPPDVKLAQDLLDAGERESVLQFLTRFKDIWQFDAGMIDHWIRLAKSTAHGDLTAGYRPGGDSFGRKPRLPEELAGKVVVIQFRNAACKTCDAQFELIKNIVATTDAATLRIDEVDKDPLTQFLEVESYPTVVLIGRDGAVRHVITGRQLDQEVRNQIADYVKPSIPARLQAPAIMASESPGTLAWKPVAGAESYVVQWDQRDEKGWQSDRDDHLVRVIPSHETSVALDPSLGETVAYRIRWRVIAVNRSGPGTPSQWNEIARNTP